MNTIIKFIVQDNTPITEGWLKNPDNAFTSASPVDKATFLLHQAVAINYLNRVYADAPSDDIVKYADKLERWWLPDLENAEADADGIEKEMVHTAIVNIKILLGITTGILDLDLIPAILSRNCDVPHTVISSFYVPYLSFVEKAPRCVQITASELQQKESFTTPNVSFPTFFYLGRILKVSYDAVFSSYNYDVAETAKYGALPYTNGPDSIFSFWKGYNWQGKSFNSTVGLLAVFALELDANITQGLPAMDAFRALYSKVFSWMSHTEKPSALSSDTLFFRRCIIQLLVYIRTKYQVMFDDKELLSSMITGNVDDADNLNQFLEAQKASEISVELYNSFRSSVFGSFAELDSYKQLMQGGSGITMNAATNPKKKTESDDDTTQEPEQDDPKSDDPPSETTDPDKPDVPELPAVEPDSTPTTGTDDPNQETNQSDDPAESDPNQTDDEPTTEPEPTEETNHTHTLKLPKVGDSKGVKLELSQGESFDTVLFRLELEHFIDAILARPPKSFSPTKIQYLEKIKANWINVLAPKCLVDMISRLVRVPKTFNFK